MTRESGLFRLSIACVFAMGVFLGLEIPSASAEGSMQRGAASMNRGTASTERGTSARRGSATTSRGGRSASLPGDRKSRKGAALPGEKKKSKYSSTSKYGTTGSSRYASDDEEEEGEVEYGERTLGRACMYGARGEVIFRPEGSICRGDTPPARAKKQARSGKKRSLGARGKRRGAQDSQRPSRFEQSNRAKHQRATRRDRSAAIPPAAPGAANAAPRRGSSGGDRCIVAGDGRVLYRPPGTKCFH